MFLYSIASKELETKLEIIKEEFKLFYDYELIDHIQTRIKKPDSIANKMKTRGLPLTYQDMIENINDINNKLDFMRKESKEDMLEHIIDADKTYLINFLSDLENGVPKTEVQIKRTYEIYERYVKNGGNSYVHDKWEEVKKLGLL